MKSREIILLSAILLCAACSATPPAETRDYLLRPPTSAGLAGAETTIGLGNIEVAPYLDQEGIVLETSPGEMTTAKHNRWADPLDYAIRRYLQVAIATASGQSVAGTVTGGVRTRIKILVHQFHGNASGSVKLVAEWNIQNAGSGDVLSRQQFSGNETLRGDGYAELVRAHAALLDRFAASIAASIQPTE